MVHAVQDNTHALPGGNQCSDTNEPANERKHAPAATSRGKSDDDVGDETSGDGEDTEAASKDDTRAVTVADSPTDEVGVSLLAEGELDGGDYIAESRWVGRVLQRMEKSLLLARRKIEFAWCVVCNVDSDNAGDLVAVWLSSDCAESQYERRSEYQGR